jgi:diguanylate cyclase (GGDEF)-like protein
LRDAGGSIVGTSTIARDITERKRAEARILELTLTDELTGLHNRRGFFTLAKLKLSLDRRLKRGLLLLYADLDGLKNINDTLGHAEGDRALQDAADILRTTFRDSDIIARMGGDEFVVLALRNLPPVPEPSLVRLQEDLDRFNRVSGRPYTLSMSVGAVLLGPESTQSLEEILSKADAEMYREKQQRRARRQS